MRVLFYGQVPKDSNYPEESEDAYAIALELNRVALSDGASESFDSRAWAKLLVAAFAQDPALNGDWLAGIVAQYSDGIDTSSLSWSKQAAFERGSFATLLGVELDTLHSSVDILSVGDSLAVLLDGHEYLRSYPYELPEEFQKRPELFCTTPSHNTFFTNADFFSEHQKTWSLEGIKNPILLCMTDALGEWALRNEKEGAPKWKVLSSITNITQLEEIVLIERDSKRMRVDDVTFVAIEMDGMRRNELPHP